MTLASTASASGAPPHSALAHVWQLLESLTDPEIPVVTLRELGILRDVRTAQAQDGTELLEVIITPPTAAALPWVKLKTTCTTYFKRMA